MTGRNCIRLENHKIVAQLDSNILTAPRKSMWIVSHQRTNWGGASWSCSSRPINGVTSQVGTSPEPFHFADIAELIVGASSLCNSSVPRKTTRYVAGKYLTKLHAATVDAAQHRRSLFTLQRQHQNLSIRVKLAPGRGLRGRQGIGRGDMAASYDQAGGAQSLVDILALAINRRIDLMRY